MPVQPNKLFSTSKADVYLLDIEMAEPLQAYLLANKERLVPFEPLRDEDYYALDNILARIESTLDDYKHKRGVSMVITPTDSAQIIGSINFTGFMYGVFQAGYLGFSVDSDFEGQGLMTEVMTQALAYVRAQ